MKWNDQSLEKLVSEINKDNRIEFTAQRLGMTKQNISQILSKHGYGYRRIWYKLGKKVVVKK